MPKIISVEVWGFESHIATTYDLDGGLTVVTGPSDGGKTSGTLRAIRWVATGEPAGEEFLHTKRTAAGEVISQAEEVGVRITLDNGKEVTKTRRNKKTKYWVTGYSEPFEKAEVPEAVKEALGIRSTVYGRDAQGKPELEYDLNFSYQLDAPFLISQPASAGAKVLGKLAGTEAIDQALKAVAKDTYAARSDKAQADKEYERKVVQLLDYTGLDEVQAELDACDWIAQQIEADLAKKENLLALQLQLDLATNRLLQAEAKLDDLAILGDLEEEMQAIEKAQLRYDTLLDLYEKLGRATATVENLRQLIQEYAGLEPAAWLLKEVEAAADRRDRIGNLSKQYHGLQETVKTAGATLDTTKDLDTADDWLQAIQRMFQQTVETRGALYDYHLALDKQQKAQRNVEYLVNLPQLAAILRQTEKDYERLQLIREAYRVYEVKADTKQRATNAQAVAEDDIRRAELQLAAAWEEAGGLCPLCEQPTANHKH